ncbi:uncharacterized protein LOC129811851 isoform X1 [Salvelinus fontinalis]|uniref:uncharacterized protein LOC129811851 isoform X1 n=1 Tax=Salvelinus fontinalis TaxID=8038 RepID=UPI0024850FF2|nr:uncharacterized protein LOC129811851 isoform X1 [Salvelinus fontinalis]XP_055719501.1 uncharacterized protein LOC129811851 isoform X1 [Salvelinus fontinalis]
MAPVGEVMGSWAVSVSKSFSPEVVVFSLLFLLLSIILLTLCTICGRQSFELQDGGGRVERTQSQLMRVVRDKTSNNNDDSYVLTRVTQKSVREEVKLENTLAARENPMINDIRKNERDFSPIPEDSVPEQLPAEQDGIRIKPWRSHRVAPDQQGDSLGSLQIANGTPVAMTTISPSPPTTVDIGDLREVLNFTPELRSIPAPISVVEDDSILESVPPPVYSGDTLDTPIMNVHHTLVLDAPFVDSLNMDSLASVDAPIVNSLEPVDIPIVNDTDPLNIPIVNDLDLLETPAEFSSNFIAQLEKEGQVEGEDQGPSLGVRPQHTYEIFGELTPDEPSVEVDLTTPGYQTIAELVHESTTQPNDDTTMVTMPSDLASPDYEIIAELVQKLSATTLPDNEPIKTTGTDPGEDLDLTSPLSLVEEVEDGLSDRGWNPMYARVSRKLSRCPTPPPVPPPEDEEEEESLPPLPERSGEMEES